MPGNPFDALENALEQFLKELGEKLGPNDPVYLDAANFQGQLHENMGFARQFQDTSALQARRYQIIYELNRLSLRHLEKDFNTFYIPSKRAVQPPGQKEDPATIPTEDKNLTQSTGNDDILQFIAQTCYNRGLSMDQKERLLVILREATMEKTKMATASNLPLDELFSQSSKFLAFQLFSLEKCRREWANLIVSDRITKESLEVLQAIQQQVFEIDLLIKQKNSEISAGTLPQREAEKIITALKGLRLEFAGIDRHLRAGPLPFEVKDALERYFNDLVYYTGKYLLWLDHLADQYKQDSWRQ